MTEKPVLTVQMVDDLMAALEPAEWTCVAGFRHAAHTGCLHPLTTAQRERLRALHRRRLDANVDAGED